MAEGEASLPCGEASGKEEEFLKRDFWKGGKGKSYSNLSVVFT